MIHYLEGRSPDDSEGRYPAWYIHGDTPTEALSHRKFLLSATLGATSLRQVDRYDGKRFMEHLTGGYDPNKIQGDTEVRVFRKVTADSDYYARTRLENMYAQAEKGLVATEVLFAEAQSVHENGSEPVWINTEGRLCSNDGNVIELNENPLDEIVNIYGEEAAETILAYQTDADTLVYAMERVQDDDGRPALLSSRTHELLLRSEPDGAFTPILTILDRTHPARLVGGRPIDEFDT